jgi:glycine hydroxymethyltransferase
VRIGTPAMTTRGVKNDDMIQIVDFIDQAINNRNNPELLKQIKEEVKNFALRFPLP